MNILFLSFSSTINEHFGSMVVTDSGIVLNNEMADFGEEGETLVRLSHQNTTHIQNKVSTFATSKFYGPQNSVHFPLNCVHLTLVTLNLMYHGKKNCR